MPSGRSDHPRSLSDAGGVRLPCVRCGTDLRKLSLKAACPTCALPVRASINPEGAGDTGDRVCATCGYSLRGLATDRCPECGASTANAKPAESALHKALGWLSSEPTNCPRCREPMLAVDEGKCRSCGLGMPPVAPPAGGPGGPDREMAAMPKQCDRCGYDLRGCTGRRCPECGAMISRRRRLAASPLSTMPLSFVRMLRARFAPAAACVVAPVTAGLGLGIATMVGATAGAAPSPSCCLAFASVAAAPVVPFNTTLAIAAAGYALGIMVAMFLATPPLAEPAAGENGFAARDRMRRAARWGSLAWLPTVVFGAQAAASGLPIWFKLLHAGVGLGLLSLAPACFHLRRVAGWVRDDRAERWFGIAGLCALAGPLLPVLVLGLGANLATFVLLLPVPMACCTALYGFAMALAWLAISTNHCVRHASDDLRRLERKAQRFAERERESQAMVRKLDAGARWGR